MTKRDIFAICLASFVIIIMALSAYFRVIPYNVFSGFTWGVVLMSLLYQCLLKK